MYFQVILEADTVKLDTENNFFRIEKNLFSGKNMGNLIHGTSTKLKEWLALFQRQRQVQYGVLVIYLLLWLIASGSLTTTILVGVGVGLGWIIGRDIEQGN